MGFDIYVDDSKEVYHVAGIPEILSLFSVYVPDNKVKFDILSNLIEIEDSFFNPTEVLHEAEILKNILIKTKRPYIKIDQIMTTIDYIGIWKYPELLSENTQIVVNWLSRLGDPKRGEIIDEPPTLVSSQGELHLVNAVAEDLLKEKEWKVLPHVSAYSFQWINNSLFGDSKPCLNVPESFKKDCYGWNQVWFDYVPIYLAWKMDIDDLIRACKDAIRNGKQLVV